MERESWGLWIVGYDKNTENIIYQEKKRRILPNFQGSMYLKQYVSQTGITQLFYTGESKYLTYPGMGQVRSREVHISLQAKKSSFVLFFPFPFKPGAGHT